MRRLYEQKDHITMRDFEKISFEQFKKDIADDRDEYESYKLPTRDSTRSAGYDIYLLSDIKLAPGEIKKIPTGVKSYFEDDEMLLLVVRSSMGFKYNVRLCNQVGIIDSDYYNNPSNEGHIWIRVQNEGDETLEFKRGEAIVQGIFVNYLATKSDLNNNLERKGGY